MGKCEISRKGRSPRELSFLRQLQICAVPQPRRGAEGSGIVRTPTLTAALTGPTASQAPMRLGSEEPFSPGIPSGARGIHSPEKQTARYSRAVADARVKDRTSFLFCSFFFLQILLHFSFFSGPKLV